MHQEVIALGSQIPDSIPAGDQQGHRLTSGQIGVPGTNVVWCFGFSSKLGVHL